MQNTCYFENLNILSSQPGALTRRSDNMMTHQMKVLDWRILEISIQLFQMRKHWSSGRFNDFYF